MVNIAILSVVVAAAGARGSSDSPPPPPPPPPPRVVMDYYTDETAATSSGTSTTTAAVLDEDRYSSWSSTTSTSSPTTTKTPIHYEFPIRLDPTSGDGQGDNEKDNSLSSPNMATSSTAKASPRQDLITRYMATSSGRAKVHLSSTLVGGMFGMVLAKVRACYVGLLLYSTTILTLYPLFVIIEVVASPGYDSMGNIGCIIVFIVVGLSPDTLW
jgi:hypothetical protein